MRKNTKIKRLMNYHKAFEHSYIKNYNHLN
jgi:hypothetical protein